MSLYEHVVWAIYEPPYRQANQHRFPEQESPFPSLLDSPCIVLCSVVQA